MTAVNMDDIRFIVEELIRKKVSIHSEPSMLKDVASQKISVKLLDSILNKKMNDCSVDEILSISISIYSSADDKSLNYVLGSRDPLNNEEKVTEETLYNLGSISKFILMTLILRLVQEGQISFQDTIVKFLTDSHLPNADAITIAHLLGHRSGLKDCDFILLKEADPITKLLKYRDGDVDLAGKPGEHFYYANINYVIISHIIQTLTKKNLQENFNRLIGEPLNLKRIFVLDQSDPSLSSAIGYKESNDLTKLIPISNHYMFGATSFRATPNDMAKLMSHFFMNDEFIKPSNREIILNSIKDEMFEVITKTNTYRWPIKMGLGIEEREVMIGENKIVKLYCHGGWQDGNAAFLAYVPENNTVYCCCVSKTFGVHRIHENLKRLQKSISTLHEIDNSQIKQQDDSSSRRPGMELEIQETGMSNFHI